MRERTMGLPWLIAAAALMVVLWRVPYGGYILYPFSALATWFHEMGHGLTAMLLGGRFETLRLYSNLSGLAYHTGSVFGGPFGRAMVSAGGPLGAPVAGFLLILSSRRISTARAGLALLGFLLILSAVLWVRTLFGICFKVLMGAAIFGALRWLPADLQGFLVQFFGVQACLSTYRQLDYLFTKDITIAGTPMLSDSARIGEILLGPYWFWGGTLAVAAFALLAAGLRLAYRPSPRPQ